MINRLMKNKGTQNAAAASGAGARVWGPAAAQPLGGTTENTSPALRGLGGTTENTSPALRPTVEPRRTHHLHRGPRQHVVWSPDVTDQGRRTFICNETTASSADCSGSVPVDYRGDPGSFFFHSTLEDDKGSLYAKGGSYRQAMEELD
ncbi:unnamed protein product [Gadus morhua 'NCC']